MKRFLIAAALLIGGSAQVAMASKTTVTISGAEQAANGMFDAGSVTVTVNGYSETLAYGQFSSSASVASGVAAKFSQDCNSPVIAHANGAVITFWTRDPSAAFKSLTASVAWNDHTDFGAASFAVSTPPPTTVTPTFACAPSSIVLGENVTCDVTLVAGATGTVSFTLNGGSWTSAAVSSTTGIAASNDGLGQVSPGTNTIAYNYPGDANTPASSGSTTITVRASGSNPVSGNTLYSYSITDANGNSGYAPNSNITAYTDGVNGAWTLGYDGLNRLTSAAITGASQYGCWAYDSFGDMLTQGISTQGFANSSTCQAQSGATTRQNSFSYSTNVNQITSGTWVGENTHTYSGNFSYDAAGNVRGDLMNQYLYDTEGRVCAEQPVGGGTITGYLYDAEGTRVAKGTLSSMTCDPTQLQLTSTYFIGPDGATMTEMSTSTGWVRTEVSGGGQYLATYKPDGIHYELTDWLGTRRMQINPNITLNSPVEDTFASWPFGDQLTPLTTLDASSRHFTGKERDAESGLDYFGARYYASNFGRWMSPDWSAKEDPVPYAKLDDPQTLNLFGYVGNNPLSRTDADGHVVGVDDAAAAILVGTAVVATAAVIYLEQPAQQRSMSQALSTGIDKISGFFQKSSAGEQGRDEKGKFLPKQDGQTQPGADAEAAGLAAAGATKNTSEVLNGTKRDGTGTGTVPGIDAGQHVESKSGKVISNSKQLKAMGKAAVAATGKPLVVVTTNPDAKLTQPALENPDLVHKPINQ